VVAEFKTASGEKRALVLNDLTVITQSQSSINEKIGSIAETKADCEEKLGRAYQLIDSLMAQFVAIKAETASSLGSLDVQLRDVKQEAEENESKMRRLNEVVIEQTEELDMCVETAVEERVRPVAKSMVEASLKMLTEIRGTTKNINELNEKFTGHVEATIQTLRMVNIYFFFLLAVKAYLLIKKKMKYKNKKFSLELILNAHFSTNVLTFCKIWFANFSCYSNSGYIN
jgi:chromosome segregation ATPase